MALEIPNLDETADIDQFLRSYRDSLTRQYDTSMATLDNQRRLNDASIMSGANRAGMMYSNLPQRSKMQYLSGTYSPAMTSVFNTYQTGKDKIRSNAVSIANDIKSIEEAISDLNTYGLGNSNSGNNNNTNSYGYPLTTNQTTTGNPNGTAATDENLSGKRVIAVGGTGNLSSGGEHIYDIVLANGERHEVSATSADEARRKWEKENQ